MILFSKGLILSSAVLALATSCQNRDDPAQETGATETTQQETPVTAPAPTTPDSGDVSAAGTMLSWTLEGAVLSYRVSHEAPSACYSAGPFSVTLVQPGNVVSIQAKVAFEDAICAQQITTLVFEGTVDDVTRPFSISATVIDARSGRDLTLEPKLE